MKETLTIEFDGGSRGNPGPAGTGTVIRAQDGTVIRTIGHFLGRATNNVAEYRALITGLREAKMLGAERVMVRGDSELIIKQMRGEYRVKNPDLKKLYDEAQAIVREFGRVDFDHNLRHHNALADKLANLAMDKRSSVFDVDDMDQSPMSDGPEGGGGVAGVRPDAPSSTVAASSPASRGGGSSAGATTSQPVGFECGHCGAEIRVVKPTGDAAARTKSFICQCGRAMQRRAIQSSENPA